MSETTTLNIRVNKDLKKQSEAILSLLGLNTSTAVNMFLNAVVIIINPTIPPASTIFIGYVPINTPFFH